MMNVCIDTLKTGENIKKYRKAKKIPLFKIQNELGLGTVQAIYKWERGECVPRMDNYLALCVLFNVPLSELLVFCDAEYAKQVKRIMGDVSMEEMYCPKCGYPIENASDEVCPNCEEHYPKETAAEHWENEDFARNYDYYKHED